MINRRFSIYLDVLRFGAAVVVLMSHFAYPRFSDGRWMFIRHLNLGSDAVVIFFVLSGLVIALTARNKDKSLGRFSFNRLTRLFSVAAPALVATFAFDRLGAWIDPDAYVGWSYNPLNLGEMLLSGLTYSSEWTGQAVRLGTNGPFWSLSYEAAYYVLFAVAMFMKGPWRLVVLALATMVFGLNVMILLPAWLAGVWLFHRLQRPTDELRDSAWMLALGPVVLYAVMLAVDVPRLLTSITEILTSPGTIIALRFSDEFLWNWLLAGCVVVHLLGMSVLLTARSEADADEDAEIGSASAPVESETSSWLLRHEGRIRWLAGASFSLYLVHYPLIQLLYSAIPRTDIWVIDDAAIIGATTLVCFLFAELFERPLKPFRALVRRGWAAIVAAVRPTDRFSSPKPGSDLVDA